MMSEQEKEIAIAKMKAQGCRRWMTILVIAPVFLCAALAVLTPTIRTQLAQREATQQCQTLSQQDASVREYRNFTTDDYASEIIITNENVDQLVLLGEIIFDGEISAASSAVRHPNGDYVIYGDPQSADIRRFFICDSENQALGAFTSDEMADIAFNADGSLFAVSDSRLAQIRFFDGIDIRELDPIELANTVSSEIRFNAEGTLLFLIDADNNQADVWAIGE